MMFITPTQYKRDRKHLRDETARLTSVVGEIRRLRAAGNILDREEADGMADFLWHERNLLRQARRRLMQSTVAKNCHLSPNAAALHAARYGAEAMTPAALMDQQSLTAAT